jgi:uncharacterized membrane protein
MSLPTITIPTVPLPFDIPVLLHPAVVHFVVAIPVVIILLEIINLFFKKRALSVFSLFLITLVALFMVSAYLSGGVDGKEAYSLLTSEGQAELKEHKLMGAYLVYGALAMVVLKLLFMAFSKVVARLFFILILIGFTVAILKQGKEGGELVYKYGANSEAIADMSSNKENIQEELDKLQEKYDELKESIATKAEEAQEAKVVESSKEEESTPTVEEEPKKQEQSSENITTDEDNVTLEDQEKRREENRSVSLDIPEDTQAK